MDRLYQSSFDLVLNQLFLYEENAKLRQLLPEIRHLFKWQQLVSDEIQGTLKASTMQKKNPNKKQRLSISPRMCTYVNETEAKKMVEWASPGQLHMHLHVYKFPKNVYPSL